MLNRMSLVCFAASYGVALLLELGRVLYRTPARPIWSWLWMAAGLLAHSTFLLLRTRQALQHHGGLVANWFDWCLLLAWGVALLYLVLSLWRSSSALGLFMLPLLLGCLGLAKLLPPDQLFNSDRTTWIWASIHGLGILVGTVSVMAGFCTGLMYLLHSYRLKHKVPPTARLKLPSLEWLGRANERCLAWSVFWLAGGILAGSVLNLVRHGRDQASVPWNDPAITMSLVLLAWLIAVAVFSLSYKPARLGRKVAYLTVANFVMLLATLAMVFFGPSDHPAGSTQRAASWARWAPVLAGRDPERLAQ